jgi:oxygen-dependent protoporphyrinogen oxidase
MVGGAKDPVTPMMDTGELVSVVREELEEIMGIGDEPVFTNILQWEKAIPLYTPGHPQRLSSLEERLGDHPGLYLTGNSYRGIGVNDCVASGMKVAEEAVAHLQSLSA